MLMTCEMPPDGAPLDMSKCSHLTLLSVWKSEEICKEQLRIETARILKERDSSMLFVTACRVLVGT